MPRNHPGVANYADRPAWCRVLQKSDVSGIWVRTLVELSDDHRRKVPVGTRALIMCAGSWRNIYLRTPSCEVCECYRSITAHAFQIEPTGEPKVADPFGGDWR